MSKRKSVLVFLAFLLLPCIALAQDKPAPRWGYVEAGFIDFDPDAGVSDDGVYGKGSIGLFKMFHLIAEYDEVGDFSFWSAGGGWHGLLGEKADLFAEAVWQDVEVDTGAGTTDDDGYVVSGGVRWSLLKFLELRGQVNQIELDNADSDTTVEAEGVFLFLNNRLGVGANFESGDSDTLRAFARFNFGK